MSKANAFSWPRARTMDGATTFTGGIVGTPSYMAPEQFEDRAIGPAADVFAWGCVIAFAATGSSPFGGGSVAAISNRILRAEPDLGGLTGPLRDLVAACLAKDEAARPSMRDLLLWLLGRPDAARAPIGEALAAGRRTAVSAEPQDTSTSVFQPGTVPVLGRPRPRAALIGRRPSRRPRRSPPPWCSGRPDEAGPPVTRAARRPRR